MDNVENITEIIASIALVSWSVYKQTQRAQVIPAARFKTAATYVILGLCVGGSHAPSGASGYVLLAASLLLSLVVGLLRGRLTKVWREPDGRILRQGTAVTIALFLGMIAAKFALGTFAYFAHINDGAGLGEVLILVGVMMGVQAQIVTQRALRLGATSPVD